MSHDRICLGGSSRHCGDKHGVNSAVGLTLAFFSLLEDDTQVGFSSSSDSIPCSFGTIGIRMVLKSRSTQIR